jgi:hypothetical protein
MDENDLNGSPLNYNSSVFDQKKSPSKKIFDIYKIEKTRMQIT